jgi:hypothetical protein
MVVVYPMLIDFTTYPLRPAHEKIVRFCRDNGIDAIDLLPRLALENVSGAWGPGARGRPVYAASGTSYPGATWQRIQLQ